MAYLFALLGSVSAVALEYLYRSRFPFLSYPLLWLSLVALVQTGVWGMYRNGASYVGIWIFFFATNMVLRTGSAFLLGEPPDAKTWVALGLVALAAVIQKIG